MILSFWTIGKPHDAYVKQGIEDFTKRISNYFKVEWHIIPSLKNTGNMPEAEVKKREADLVLPALDKNDYLVLLDERGNRC
jgi:23S rRNA (pseudouridine1915-N3)-methyltransferase